MRLKFISYDGRYPNLCSGNLVLELDGNKVPFPKYCLASGGECSIGDDCEEDVTEGPWEITSWPDGFPDELKDEARKLVNDNIRAGCCGGCL